MIVKHVLSLLVFYPKGRCAGAVTFISPEPDLAQCFDLARSATLPNAPQVRRNTGAALGAVRRRRCRHQGSGQTAHSWRLSKSTP